MQASAAHGGADCGHQTMLDVIGVSFTAELLLKAAYEETLGRVATWVRGEPTHARLDDVSARQAADYADFLHQIPWYRWDFDRDRGRAWAGPERGPSATTSASLALGIEYRVKAAYARAIGAAVAATGFDALTMRSIVAGLSPEELAAIEGVTVIAERPQGIEIETPRYEAFTGPRPAPRGSRAPTFVEIAGNDEILVTSGLGADRTPYGPGRPAPPGKPGRPRAAARQGHGPCGTPARRGRRGRAHP